MHSDTYHKAQEVADRLLIEGVRPTQQLVRDELGKGSLSTIHRALTDWWQGLGKRLSQQSEIPDIPDSVSSLMVGLWEASVAAASRHHDEQLLALQTQTKRSRQAVSDIQQRSDCERAEMLHKLEAAYGKIELLQRQIGELQSELVASERRTLDSQVLGAGLERENRTLSSAIERLEGELAATAALPASQRELELKEENRNLRRAIERLDSKAAD